MPNKSNGSNNSKAQSFAAFMNTVKTVASTVNKIDKEEAIQGAVALISMAQDQANREITKVKEQLADLISDKSAKAKSTVNQVHKKWEASKTKLPPIVYEEVDSLLDKMGFEKPKPKTKGRPARKAAKPVAKKPAEKKKAAAVKKKKAVKAKTAKAKTAKKAGVAKKRKAS